MTTTITTTFGNPGDEDPTNEIVGLPVAPPPVRPPVQDASNTVPVLEPDDPDHSFFTRVGGEVVAEGHDITAVDAVHLRSRERGRLLRRPVAAEWVTEPESLREVLFDFAARQWHSLKFHGARSPIYVGRLVATSPYGLRRAVVAAIDWRKDLEYHDAVAAIRDGGRGDVEHLSVAHRSVVRARTRALVLLCLLAPPVIVLLWLSRPLWLVAALGAAVVLLGWYGRPARSTPIVERAVYRAAQFPPFTEDLMVQSLRTVLGASKGKRDIQVIQPPAKTRTGWEAVVSVPGSATEVVKKREEFAGEIGRPNSCVWMATGDTAGDGEDRSAAWLQITVTRKSLRRLPMPAWPLLEAGSTDYFVDEVPVGIDAMGEPVTARKAYQSTIWAGIMGSGKSVSMMTQVLGECSDDRVELHVYDFKGGVDWEPLSRFAHVYVSGSDTADHEMILADLTELNTRLDERAKTLKQVNAEGIKTPKITSELADRADLDFAPIKIVIDETQEPFEYAPKKMGDEYRRLLFRLIKKGRAYGITVDAGTQEVKDATLPWRSLAAWKHCHMVSSHTQVELVLGTGAYAAGNHADKLVAADVGIGFFGTGKDLRLVRGYFIDPDDGTLDTVCDRLAQRRQSRGLLTGMAAGELDPDTDLEGTLDRVARVWGGDPDRLHLVELVDLLHRDMPDEYPAVTDESLKTETVARAVQVLSGQLSRNLIEADNMRRPFLSPNRKSVVRKGIRWADVLDALETRRRRPEQPDHEQPDPEHPHDGGSDWDDTDTDLDNDTTGLDEGDTAGSWKGDSGA